MAEQFDYFQFKKKTAWTRAGFEQRKSQQNQKQLTASNHRHQRIQTASLYSLVCLVFCFGSLTDTRLWFFQIRTRYTFEFLSIYLRYLWIPLPLQAKTTQIILWYEMLISEKKCLVTLVIFKSHLESLPQVKQLSNWLVLQINRQGTHFHICSNHWIICFIFCLLAD